jgi:glycosyltransferase involved in cell wall biosynthesis
MYDLIIVTHIPNFYKINLYNKLSKNKKIFVIFIATNTNEKRANDFIDIDKAEFDYTVLYKGYYESRDIRTNIIKLKALLKQNNYKRILVSGWNSKEYWYCIFANKKTKNCLALESTIYESNTKGIKGFMKKIFLSRISIVFASGTLHKCLLEQLNYKGEVKITKGVGIINKPNYNLIKKHYKKRFIFIGRLSEVKNINMLVDLFNHLEEYMLTIIGSGPLEKELKDKAKSNIVFKGQIANEKLDAYFENNDILILPSISETWGLVVEEAIYFGMPVIVSSNCGVSELVKDGVNGYLIDLRNPNKLKDIILGINDSVYQNLIDGVCKFSINKKDLEQVALYDV